jgi:hypothetical protein
MLVRATLFALPLFAALAMCGCNSESPYNIPADPAKEAAELAPNAPPRRAAVGRKKVTKPPGGTPKEGRNLRPSQ